jgi:hypothetical protein
MILAQAVVAGKPIASSRPSSASGFAGSAESIPY